MISVSAAELKSLRDTARRYDEIKKDVGPISQCLVEVRVLLAMDAVEYSGGVAMSTPHSLENATVRFDNIAKEIVFGNYIAGKPTTSLALRYSDITQVTGQKGQSCAITFRSTDGQIYTLNVVHPDKHFSLLQLSRHVLQEYSFVKREELLPNSGVYILRYERNFPSEPTSLKVDNTTPYDIEIEVQLQVENLMVSCCSAMEGAVMVTPTLARQHVPRRGVAALVTLSVVDAHYGATLGYDATWRVLDNPVQGVHDVPPGVEWRRVGNVVPLFGNAMSVADVTVGVGMPLVGSVLRVMAENPDRLQQYISITGKYRVLLCHNGWWTPCVIDDLVAIQPSYFGGCTSGSWYDILYKACATVAGGYTPLHAMRFVDLFRMLTGLPCREVVVTDGMWGELCAWSGARMWMAAAPRKGGPCYAVLQSILPHRMVSVRSPTQTDAVCMEWDKFVAVFQTMTVCYHGGSDIRFSVDVVGGEAIYALRLDTTTTTRARLTVTNAEGNNTPGGLLGLFIIRRSDDVMAWTGLTHDTFVDIDFTFDASSTMPYFVIPVWRGSPTTTLIVSLHTDLAKFGKATIVQPRENILRACFAHVCHQQGTPTTYVGGAVLYTLSVFKWFGILLHNMTPRVCTALIDFTPTTTTQPGGKGTFSHDAIDQFPVGTLKFNVVVAPGEWRYVTSLIGASSDVRWNVAWKFHDGGSSRGGGSSRTAMTTTAPLRAVSMFFDRPIGNPQIRIQVNRVESVTANGDVC